MLRLYHFAGANCCARADQLLELSQCLTACNRKGGKTNEADYGSIEHPLRNLEQTLP